MNTGVYMIQNKENKKVYIGSAVDIEKRWREHRRTLKQNKHHSPRLQHSWNKWGEEAFEFSIIELCEKENLIQLEQFLLDLLIPYEPEKGYNICKTAGSWLGLKHTEETKKKLSEASRGKNNPLYGKTRSEETRKKIGESQRGKGKGYYFHKPTGKYRAQIKINGKRKYLGLYDIPEEARKAYLEAANNILGEYK